MNNLDIALHCCLFLVQNILHTIQSKSFLVTEIGAKRSHLTENRSTYGRNAAISSDRYSEIRLVRRPTRDFRHVPTSLCVV